MRLSMTIIAAAVLALAACEATTKRAGFEVSIAVQSDDGSPLPGVRVAADEVVLGTTGPNGVLLLTLEAPDGTRMRVSPICPDGFDAPKQGAPLVLRSFDGLDRKRSNQLAVSLTCRPRQRTVAVVVRADGHGDLPVLVDGEVVGRTNDKGVAHLTMRRPSNATFRVALDTSARPRLQPQNPEVPFVLAAADDIFVFDQSFEQRKAKKRKRRRKRVKVAPKPTGPVKIQSNKKRRWRAL